MTSSGDGRKGVAIGQREYLGNWYGVMDAWFPFLRKTFGPAWFDGQRRRPAKDQHVLMRWDAEARRLREATPLEKDGGKLVRVTASVFGYFMFAWDLVLVEENVGLPAKLIDRLKDRLTFQGARHELFAAAVLARAGYSVVFQDESDHSVKHVEMVGIHKKCGQQVAVEAKSRHVDGVLDFRSKTGKKGRLEFGSLLRKAFRKPAEVPLVVFLDLNVPPPAYSLRYKDVARRVKSDADARTRNTPSPFNLLIATNLALHYGEGELMIPKKGMFVLVSTNPRVKPKYPAALKEIADQANNYGSFLPRRFEDLTDQALCPNR